jgi:hypothetical protein
MAARARFKGKHGGWRGFGDCSGGIVRAAGVGEETLSKDRLEVEATP